MRYILNKNSILFSAGFFSLLLYYASTYLFQPIYQLIFFDKFDNIFFGIDYNFLTVFIVIFFFTLIVVFIDSFIPHINLKLKINQNTQKIVDYFIIVILVILFVLSIYFYYNFGINFRHSSRLRDAGSFVKILFFLRVIAFFYLFYIFVLLVNKITITKLINFNLIIITLSFIFSANSSYDVLIIATCIFLLSPIKIRNFFMYKNENKIIYLYMLSSLLFLSFAVILFGIANKIGIERTLDLFSDLQTFKSFFSDLFARFSTSYVSALLMINDHMFNLNLQIKTYEDYSSLFLSRLSSVLPILDYKLDDIVGINRTNYFLLFKESSEEKITGASPGLIASIFYIPYSFFNVIIISIYVVIIIRITNRYIPKKRFLELSLFSKLIIFMFTFTFFEVPLQLLNLIHPSTIFIFLFLIVSFFTPFSEKLKNVI